MEEWLKLLACPVCKEKLVLSREKTKMLCRQCRLAYSVKNQIPTLLKEKAEPWLG